MKVKNLICCTLTAAILTALAPFHASAAEEPAHTGDETVRETEALPAVVSEPVSEDAEAVNERAAAPVSRAAEYSTYNSGGVLTLGEYDALLAGFSGTPEELAVNPDYEKILLQRRLVEKTGYDALIEQMKADSAFKECIDFIFSDHEMLKYYVFGGEPEANGHRDGTKQPTAKTYMDSFKVCSKIYEQHKADVQPNCELKGGPGLYKRLMVAIAQTHCVRVTNWLNRDPAGGRPYKWITESEPVGRYELYKKFYLNKFLVTEFDTLNVEELRLVVSAPIDNDQLEWMHHYFRVIRGKNTDYATNPRQYSINQAPDAPMKYAAEDFAPRQFGGVHDEFYTSDMYETWNQKYVLRKHDGYFDYETPYGYNEQG